MELELLMRTEGEFTDEQLEELNAIAQLEDDPQAFLDSAVTFKYEPITFDMDDVGPFFRLDDTHTQVHLSSCSMAFVAKVDYKTFQTIREAMTGRAVKTLNDFKINE